MTYELGVLNVKNMNRAIRRHHSARLKKARRHYWGRNLSQNAKELGGLVDTPCQCSCWMCGHQRKHHGPTVQERRAGATRSVTGRQRRSHDEWVPREPNNGHANENLIL